jgi:hypothetical protein
LGSLSSAEELAGLKTNLTCKIIVNNWYNTKQRTKGLRNHKVIKVEMGMW